jgi:O-antigen/teichoic acid export membrane protein
LSAGRLEHIDRWQNDAFPSVEGAPRNRGWVWPDRGINEPRPKSFPMSIRRNAVWNAANALVARAAGLLFWFIVARSVSRDELGILLTVQSTALTAMLLLSAGFASASTQFIASVTDEARLASSVRTAATVGLCASIALAVLLFLSADLIASVLWHRPELYQPIRLASIFAFACGLAACANAILAGLHSFRHIAIVSIVANLAQLAVVPYLVGRLGFTAAIVVLSSTQFLIGLAGLALIWRRFGMAIVARDSPTLPPIRGTRSLLAQTAWAALAHSAFNIAGWIAMAFLLRQSEGLRESAVFGIGNQWRQITLFAPMIAMQVALPAFAMLASSPDHQTAASELLWVGRLTTACAFASAVIIGMGAPWILEAYGKGYEDGAWSFALLQLTALMQSWQAYRITEIQGVGKFHLILAINLAAATAIVATAAVTAQYGALGIAIAYVVGFIITQVALFVTRSH